MMSSEFLLTRPQKKDVFSRPAYKGIIFNFVLVMFFEDKCQNNIQNSNHIQNKTFSMPAVLLRV